MTRSHFKDQFKWQRLPEDRKGATPMSVRGSGRGGKHGMAMNAPGAVAEPQNVKVTV